MEAMDMVSKEGLVRLTTDPSLLDQLHPKDYEKYIKPSFSATPDGDVRIKSLIFVEYQDTSKAGGKVCISDTKKYAKKMAQPNSIHDFVLLPIEIDMKFKASLKDGELFQTFEGSNAKGKLNLRQCSYVKNANIVDDEDSKADKNDDDEDFADFDDFGEVLEHLKDKSDRALKNSDMQRLACTLIDQGNKKIRKNMDIIGSYFEKFVDAMNSWFAQFSNTPEANNGNLGHAINVACSGWDIHPWRARLDNDRIVVSAQLNREPLYQSDYCNRKDGELYLNDARELLAHEWAREYLSEEVAYTGEHGRFWPLRNLIDDNGWLQSADTSPKHFLSPLMFQLSSHFHLRDFCWENYPNSDPEKCAFIFGFFRKYREYD